jgi:hypothetical protein
MITGTGLTRVGKSTLAQQIGAYVSRRLDRSFSVDNMVFGGKQMIDLAHRLPHNSVIIDDESREDLSSKSQMEFQNKSLMNFFNECGMYNHLIILVATDFFDFNRSIALTRSELLINCVRSSRETKDADGNPVLSLGRGDYDIYDRNGKRILYVTGKKNFNQYDYKYCFGSGTFNSRWLIDKTEYERRKLEFLRRDREKTIERKTMKVIYNVVKNLKKEKISNNKISEIIGVDEKTIRNYIKTYTEMDNKIIDSPPENEII